jgi:hypothetical protein
VAPIAVLVALLLVLGVFVPAPLRELIAAAAAFVENAA